MSRPMGSPDLGFERVLDHGHGHAGHRLGDLRGLVDPPGAVAPGNRPVRPGRRRLPGHPEPGPVRYRLLPRHDARPDHSEPDRHGERVEADRPRAEAVPGGEDPGVRRAHVHDDLHPAGERPAGARDRAGQGAEGRHRQGGGDLAVGERLHRAQPRVRHPGRSVRREGRLRDGPRDLRLVGRRDQGDEGRGPALDDRRRSHPAGHRGRAVPHGLRGRQRLGGDLGLGVSLPVHARAVAFDPNDGNLRFAVLDPGGVAFSRDAGQHWMPLGVTDPLDRPDAGLFDPTANPAPARGACTWPGTGAA